MKYLLLLLPSLAVVIGLHVFKRAVLAIALYHTLILVTLALARPRLLLGSILKGWDSRMGLGLVAAGIMGGIIIYILRVPMLRECPTIAQVLACLGLWDCNWIWFALYFSIVNPLLEEVFWTGYLSSRRLAPLAENISFALYHVLVLSFFLKAQWLVVAFCVLAVVSYMWKAAYRRQGGLLVGLLSHLAADASIIVAISVMRRM